MSKKAALGFAVCVSVAWSTTLLCLLLSGFSFVFFFFFNTYPEGLASQRMITQRDECRKGLETQTTIHFAGEVRISHKEKIKKENPWFFSVIH